MDHERVLAGEEGISGTDDTQLAGVARSSAALMGDLEDLKQKVDRYQKRRDDSNVSELQSRAQAVVECYRWI